MKQFLLKYVRVDDKLYEMRVSEDAPNIHAYLFWFFLAFLPILGLIFLM
jgi:hypothetical protein